MYFILESKDELHNFNDNDIHCFQQVRSPSIESRASADYRPFSLCTIKAHFPWTINDPAQGIHTQDPSLFLFVRR